MYVPMADIIPEGVSGNSIISHFTLSKQDVEFSMLRAAMGHSEEAMRPGRYVKLEVNGMLMMTDTQNEQQTNRWFVHRAKGAVLIAGLGVGMVLVPVMRKEEVRRVTVIEKYQGVIDLVEPALRANLTDDQNEKLEIICADIFTWKLSRGTKWDTIYFDIWPDSCVDNLKEITKLKRRFARRKTTVGWMGAWEEQKLRSRRRQGGW